MATTTKSTKVAASKTSRYNELKKMLEERRRELLSEVQGKIRDVRAESGKERDVLDQGESSEVDIQEDKTAEEAMESQKAQAAHSLTDALGVTEEEAQKLAAEGMNSLEVILTCEPEDIAGVLGIDNERAGKILEAARQVSQPAAQPAA